MCIRLPFCKSRSMRFTWTEGMLQIGLRHRQRECRAIAQFGAAKPRLDLAEEVAKELRWPIRTIHSR